MARKTQAEVEALLRKHFPGVQAKLIGEIFAALNADVAAVEADVTALDTWGATLATKLNADAGVTDTNYDTTPL